MMSLRVSIWVFGGRGRFRFIFLFTRYSFLRWKSWIGKVRNSILKKVQLAYASSRLELLMGLQK
jgi:hypothetical protein